MWQNSKSPIVTNLKISNCKKILKSQALTKLKISLLPNSKPQIVTTKNLKLWQNWKSQIVIKLKISNRKLWQNSNFNITSILVKATQQLNNLMICSQGSLLQSSDVFSGCLPLINEVLSCASQKYRTLFFIFSLDYFCHQWT